MTPTEGKNGVDASPGGGDAAAMLDVLIVSKNSRYGLAQDAALLGDALAAARPDLRIGQAGHRDRPVLERLLRRRRALTIVHIERVFPRWFSAGERHLLVPNQERFPRRHLGRLSRITLVLAKSRHAEAIFAAHGAPAHYLGFLSADRRDPSVERDWGAVLHLAGASTLKGTEDILALWAAHPEWPTLHLVQKAHLAPASVPQNVSLRSDYLGDGELRALQNRCGIHLCPSRAEGWGHYLVEAMSVGALIVTADAPPMNEHVDAASALLVPVARTEPRRIGQAFFVDRTALEARIAAALALSEPDKQRFSEAARAAYDASRSAFGERLQAMRDVF